jgi:hypothetical protein
MACAVVHFSVPLARAGSGAAVAAASADSGLLFAGGGCVIAYRSHQMARELGREGAKPWAPGC